MCVYARRTIRAGEEICLSYGRIDRIKNTKDRQTSLMEHFGFFCHCQRCLVGDVIGGDSTAAEGEFKSKLLDVYASMQNEGGPSEDASTKLRDLIADMDNRCKVENGGMSSIRTSAENVWARFYADEAP